jgi:hypothetical protein
MLFRYGLRELARGVDPTSPSWLVSNQNPVLRSGSHLPVLGPIPGFGSWPLGEQRGLMAAAQGAELARVAKEAAFPDWLGYLGLVLRYTYDAELEDLTLTRAWSPQLARLVPQGSEVCRLLYDLPGETRRPLTWRLLEAVEFAGLDLSCS